MNILSSFVNFINKNDDINVNKAKLKSYLGVDNDAELVDLLERTKIKKAIKNFNKDRIEAINISTKNTINILTIEIKIESPIPTIESPYNIFTIYSPFC